jgi:hypothetical protein
MESLSALDFSRSDKARLLGLARGIIYFTSSVPFDIISYNCRVGHMPAYSSIYSSLQGLAAQESNHIFTKGKDPNVVSVLILDNVQNYHKQRDLRVGRENTMNVGIAATWVELEGINPKALDLADKRARLAENKRKDVTVESLLNLIDHSHIETIGTLQILRTLADHIPELAYLKPWILILYRTRASKQPLPVRKTKIHPLATSGKSETIITELKDAFLDFYAQTGQTDGNYLKRLMLAGGDGLTYNQMLLLKKYLQFHDDEFQSFELMDPILQVWHTLWTNLSRIAQVHYGPPLSRDPSTLGHSAAKIGRPTPAKLNKVDFYTFSDTLFTVMNARILDCCS